MRLAFSSSIITDGNPTSGFEIANEAIVGGLRSLGHEVVVFGFRMPRQQNPIHFDTQILQDMNLENSEASFLKKLEWLLRAQFKGLPVASAKLSGFSQQDVLHSISKLGPFDGYIVNSYQMAGAFPKILGRPYIYIAHNMEHRSAAQNAKSASSSLQRYFYRRDERLLERLEATLCDGAQFVWTLSDDDLLGLNVPKQKGCTLPLVLPQQKYEGASSKIEWDFGLIGTWSWQPNLVGLNWFLSEIVPLLPHGFRIAVAGNAPQELAQNHERVQFLGRVENADQFLRSVQVIPLVSRGGTGVQLKTIEAFQAGYSCVATKSSLRGIDKIPNNCLTADDPKAFSEALISLVESPKNRPGNKTGGKEFYSTQLKALKRGLKRGLGSLA